jgi:hypothetical protein
VCQFFFPGRRHPFILNFPSSNLNFHHASLLLSIMVLDHETCSTKRIVASGGEINCFYGMDGQNCHGGGKTTQHLPCHSNYNNLQRWKSKESMEMLELESQYRLKRRPGWFLVTICAIASIFALASSRVPQSWGLSLSLDQFSSLVSRSGPASPADVKVLQATSQVQKFNRTDQVQFDNYSLILRGQRIFL